MSGSRWWGVLASTVAAVFLTGTAAAASPAATLTVTAKPTTVHRNETYTITVAGRYGDRGLHTTPHLLVFVQYSSALCQRTARAEYALPVSEWSWLTYPQQAERRSPFKQVFYEEARTRYGGRRVCAYLYAEYVDQQTTAKPMARAGAWFSEVKG